MAYNLKINLTLTGDAERTLRDARALGLSEREILSKALYLLKMAMANQLAEVLVIDERITHTWLRTHEGWKIIGGMSAPAVADASARL